MASGWREALGKEPEDGAGFRQQQTMFMVGDLLRWRDAGAARMISGISARSNNNALPNSVFLWSLGSSCSSAFLRSCDFRCLDSRGRRSRGVVANRVDGLVSLFAQWTFLPAHTSLFACWFCLPYRAAIGCWPEKLLRPMIRVHRLLLYDFGAGVASATFWRQL